MTKVESTIKHLLETNPFYAHFFLNCEIQYNTSIPTAGVCMTNRGVRMVFNPEFIARFSVKELGAIIEHETLHILFEHVWVPKRDKTIQVRLANIAMDCAINQYIQELPIEGVSLEVLSKLLNQPLEAYQTWEYYYHKIMQDPKVQESIKSLDDHSEWEEGEYSPADRAMARAAAESALKSSKGQAPQGVLRALDALKNNPTVPWQQVLANFISRATSSTSKNTRKKRNRRFGIDQPGKVKKRELVLGVCCDSSGSVSDEDYSKFMDEIDRISQYCSKVWLLDADCEVQDIKELTKGRKTDRMRKGAGGTTYQPAITKCVELKVDAILYFGDFDSSDTPENPGIPFLWVGVGNQDPPGDFGGVLRI